MVDLTTDHRRPDAKETIELIKDVLVKRRERLEEEMNETRQMISALSSAYLTPENMEAIIELVRKFDAGTL